MCEPQEHTYIWTKLHKGDVIPGGYLPGILHEEANSTGIPIWSWHIFFESAPGKMNGPIINLKSSNWECPVEIQDYFNAHGLFPLTAYVLAL